MPRSLADTCRDVMLAIIAKVALTEPQEAEAMREIMRRDGHLEPRRDAA